MSAGINNANAAFLEPMRIIKIVVDRGGSSSS